MSQDEEGEMMAGVRIELLTDDKRLRATIPNYDTHYRLYFDNPEAFATHQGGTGGLRPEGGKVHE